LLDQQTIDVNGRKEMRVTNLAVLEPGRPRTSWKEWRRAARGCANSRRTGLSG